MGNVCNFDVDVARALEHARWLESVLKRSTDDRIQGQQLEVLYDVTRALRATLERPELSDRLLESWAAFPAHLADELLVEAEVDPELPRGAHLIEPGPAKLHA